MKERNIFCCRDWWIPDVDRGKTESKNLIYVVLSTDDDKILYKLETFQRVLIPSYFRHEFTSFE